MQYIGDFLKNVHKASKSHLKGVSLNSAELELLSEKVLTSVRKLSTHDRPTTEVVIWL